MRPRTVYLFSVKIVSYVNETRTDTRWSAISPTGTAVLQHGDPVNHETLSCLHSSCPYKHPSKNSLMIHAVLKLWPLQTCSAGVRTDPRVRTRCIF